MKKKDFIRNPDHTCQRCEKVFDRREGDVYFTFGFLCKKCKRITKNNVETHAKKNDDYFDWREV